MNFYMSIFFRLVPLLMGAICLGYGFYVNALKETVGTGYIVAGHVLIALTAICIALFTTAATIIRQLIKRYNNFYKFALPILGYLVSVCTIIYGIYFWRINLDNPSSFVSGNIIFAVGLISCCVSTVATTSTKFVLITQNEATLQEGERPKECFSDLQVKVLGSIPIICTIVALIRGFYLLMNESKTPYFVAGHVVLGIALICASLIALVFSILRQIQNKFTNKERYKWTLFVILMGTIDIIWGIVVLVVRNTDAWIAPGFVLIGLGLVCYSISSKVVLLAAVWRKTCSLSNRIPLIPVVTALTCLFLSAFLFEAAVFNPAYFVPARVMVGLGGVCFTLFSIVSILESGTANVN